MSYALRLYKGWTIDGRVREFCVVWWDEEDARHIEVAPFDSPEGRVLLAELRAYLEEGGMFPGSSRF